MNSTPYYELRNLLNEGNYTLYNGGKNLKERGFKGLEYKPDKVYLDATVDPNTKLGYIVKIDPNNPNLATVQIGTGANDYRTVHSIHMFAMNINGFIRNPVFSTDFSVGDVVYVGAGYSQKIGIVEVSAEEFNDRIKVKLPSELGSSIICYIKCEHLLKSGLNLLQAEE